jgi:TatD DNase family protein
MHDKDDLDKLAAWLSSHQHVAVGECGLDYRKGQTDRDQQQFYFAAQLDIARQLNKPIVIHAVKASQQVIDTLKTYPELTGMVHSYSGSYEQAQQLIDMGFYLGFGGAVTYPHASRLNQLVRRLPLTALLLETDAPDQPDAQHEKQRNEPAYLSNVVDYLSELRDEPAQLIAQQSATNARALFRLAG